MFLSHTHIHIQVDSRSLLDTYQHFIHSSFRVGTIGYNINVSNILAAVFIATGQDVASVVESSTCQLILAPATKEEIEQAVKGAGGVLWVGKKGGGDEEEGTVEEVQCKFVTPYKCLFLRR